jgi:hypothetical protein
MVSTKESDLGVWIVGATKNGRPMATALLRMLSRA